MFTVNEDIQVYVGDENVFLLEGVHVDAEVDYGPNDFEISEEVTELLHSVQLGQVEPLPKEDGVVVIPSDFEGVILKGNGHFYSSPEEFEESYINRAREATYEFG